MQVTEMAYVPYNANKDDKNKNDCSIRALSLAYDKPYESVSKELRGMSRNTDRHYNSLTNLTMYIKKTGFIGNEVWVKSDRLTVEQFSEKYPNGTYLVLTGNKPKSNDTVYSSADYKDINHIVCIIDGDAFDSWNSMREYVKMYCLIDEDVNSSVNKERLDTQDVLTYAKEFLQEAIDEYMPDGEGDGFTLLDFYGVTDTSGFKQALSSGGSAFYVSSADKFTCGITYLLGTDLVAEREGYKSIVSAYKKENHVGKIVIKFSPKLSNDDILDKLELEITEGIKKLCRALKKEQKQYDELTSGSIWKDFPNLGDESRFASAYKLLSKCDPWIKKNVIKCDRDYYYGWYVTCNCMPEDDYNMNDISLPRLRGRVDFAGKNPKQINAMYKQYDEDVREYGAGTEHTYVYSSWYGNSGW